MSKLTERHALWMNGFPAACWQLGCRCHDGTYDGHGRCYCGSRSVLSLDSDAARRRWHRQHKAEALGASLKSGPQ